MGLFSKPRKQGRIEAFGNFFDKGSDNPWIPNQIEWLIDGGMGMARGPKEKARMREEMERRGKEIYEEGHEDKAGLIGSLFDSMLARYFPDASKWYDLARNTAGAVGIMDERAEAYPWKNELDTILALIGILPGKWQAKIQEIVVPIIEKISPKYAAEMKGKPDMFVEKLREYLKHLHTVYVAAQKIVPGGK